MLLSVSNELGSIIFPEPKRPLKCTQQRKGLVGAAGQGGQPERRAKERENDNYLRVIGIRIVVPPGKRANKENGRNCISSFSPA